MTRFIIATIAFALLTGCADRTKPSPSAGALLPDLIFRTYVHPAPTYVPDPQPDRVKNVIFATVPPDYYAERAEIFARNGIDGVMMNGIMGGWESDIWQQPNQYTPNTPPGRIVGESNPLLQMCRRMNQRCREAGIEHNSVKLHFSRHLPDWFDDAAWRQVADNFRQCAIFSRDGGFAGVTLDIEYISETYQLDYEAYRVPGYPRDRMRHQAAQRGFEILDAMLREYPGMVFWLLPEWAPTYETLAGDLFRGMVDALAAHDAPGGIHLCTENTYRNTRPRGLMTVSRNTDLVAQRILRELGTQRAYDYWMRRGTMAIGMWPLGYCRELYDSTGTVIGYTGKNAVFHGTDVGSNADKSENYSPAEFRQQLAAARTLGQRFTWTYSHGGSTFWQMTSAEVRRYHASSIDTVPVVGNLDEFFAVMREKKILDDPLFAEAAAAVRERRPYPAYQGFPEEWRILGPIPYRREDFAADLPHELTHIKTDAPVLLEGKTLAWRTTRLDSSRAVNLSAFLGKQGMPLAYGVAWCETSRPMRAWIRVGSNDYGAVFLNGRRVYIVKEERPVAIDDDSVPVDLPAGRSTVVVKCGDAGGSKWGFTLRITDERGNVIPGLRWVGP